MKREGRERKVRKGRVKRGSEKGEEKLEGNVGGMSEGEVLIGEGMSLVF